MLAFHSTLTCRQDVDMTPPNLTDVGYINIESFSATSNEESQKYANSIQETIAKYDNKDLKGWIIDLRNNRGGNMWPMISGVGPLLTGYTHGYFVNADKIVSAWGYNNGSANYNNKPLVSVEKPYTLKSLDSPIAVLSSNRVASSGEALMISFKKQSNVRFFGSNSCGASTSNQTFKLSNGDYLVLTTSIMLDRDKAPYGKQVSVDVSVRDEDVIGVAKKWIEEY